MFPAGRTDQDYTTIPPPSSRQRKTDAAITPFVSARGVRSISLVWFRPPPRGAAKRHCWYIIVYLSFPGQQQFVIAPLATIHRAEGLNMIVIESSGKLQAGSVGPVARPMPSLQFPTASAKDDRSAALLYTQPSFLITCRCMPDIDKNSFGQPKVELHAHLEGSIPAGPRCWQRSGGMISGCADTARACARWYSFPTARTYEIYKVISASCLAHHG